MAGIREEARALFEETDYLVVADIMCLGPFEGACFLRGYEDFCTDLHWNPELATPSWTRSPRPTSRCGTSSSSTSAPTSRWWPRGDDLGIQRGPLISPAMYRQIIRPYHKRLYDFIHSRTSAKLFMHSCGSVFDLIPDLIEAGVQVLNPIQRSAAKMDIAVMKREFGRELCFWGGGIDVQQVLPYATLERIRDEVAYSIETLGKDGGYVFCPAHNVQPDVSPDRIDVMYRAALAHRG